MIRTLRVRNLAVIEELELELGPGLNVLTGETGAGKSILVGALGLLRGGRASSGLVRAGAESATVEAVFDDPELLARAREEGLAEEGDEELLVTRSVSREGRGRVRVNGALATVGVLGRLVGDRLEAAGQGEHHRLVRGEVQSALLHRFAGIEQEAASCQELHRRWSEIGRAIAEHRSSAEERLRLEDRLRFEIEQIRAVDPKEGEIEELETERNRLAHADRLGRDAGAVREALAGEEGLRDRIGALQSRLTQAACLDRTLEPAAAGLERAGLELGEALGELDGYTASLELDPARLDVVEGRLLEIQRIGERYGSTVSEILEYKRRAEEELAKVEGGEALLEAREREQAEVASALSRTAEGLSERRRKAGAELAQAMESELSSLELKGARLEVRFEPVRSRPLEGHAEGMEAPSGPRGRERAELWLAPNPGEEPRPLRDCASGGELARVLLGLRTVLREADRGQVLLLDEVDAGIGGRTARRVGERLQSLGTRHQVLCITHLPQIAALGKTHYRIAKQVRQGRTVTRVEPVSGEERVLEIARMAGAGRVTPAARAHARELLSS